jgi:hypothetical protein
MKNEKKYKMNCEKRYERIKWRNNWIGKWPKVTACMQ